MLPVAVSFAQPKPVLKYTISIPDPASHAFQVTLETGGWSKDTLNFKMPRWMPGYYQIMDYHKNVENLVAMNDKGKPMSVDKVNPNTWRLAGVKGKSFQVKYTVATKRKFVATSYVDSAHAYIVTAGSLMYADGHLQLPASVKVEPHSAWKNIATGLEPIPGKTNEFTAPDFDVLYDSPILTGNLEELTPFKVKGIDHRFIGYAMGDFDKTTFINALQKVVEASVAVIGDIPYKRYTFIAIGPGRGGIEHLNNTTFSFDGKSMATPEGTNRMMNFLAHEYFHHYNVKRIRPLELGPFDYDQGSRTNLLWVSEGLSVYYEYLIVKRAGLVDLSTLLSHFDGNLNAHENNPGRFHQSLTQASYNTWKDGPFGTQGDEPGKAISYYDKGPLVGLLLDLEIRQATKNAKSLDDVMREIYWMYYKQAGRGFTDAEFQQACETVAGVPLTKVFEFVYTTKELDYDGILGYAGLKIERQPAADDKSKPKMKIARIQNPDALQQAILKSLARD